MANLDVNIRRTIELETELRLVKQQLTQAQQGTQYLVNCFSAQQSRAQTGFNSEVRVRELEVENAILRKSLARPTDDDGATSQSSRGYTSFRGLEAPFLHRQHCALTDQAHRFDVASENLVDIDDCLPPAFTTEKFPLPVSHATSSHHIFTPTPHPRSTGLGIVIPDPSQSSSAPVTDLLSEDLTPSTCHKNAREWKAIRAPAPPEQDIIFERPFHDREHNKLAGMATFLEDMEEGEKKHYFERCADKDRRHSADEWRTYYEAAVRPKFLARFGGVTRAGGEGSVGGNERANVSVNGNVQPAQQDIPDKEIDGSGPHSVQDSERTPESPIYTAEDLHEVSKVMPRTTEQTKKVGEPLPQVTNPVQASEDDPSPPIEQSPDNGQKLTPETDSPLTSEDEAQPVATTTGADQSDLLPCSPIQKAAQLAVVLCPKASPSVPESSSQAIEVERVHDEPRVREKSKGRSRGRSRGRRWSRNSSASDNGPKLFYAWGSANPDLRRTVLITNIPTTVTLATVISKIRGGRIVHAKYIDSARWKTSPPVGNTVIVLFLKAQNAAAFVAFTQEREILLGYDEDSRAVKMNAKLIEMPSRPLSNQLYESLQHNGLTRVLFIIDGDDWWEPEEIMEELQKKRPDVKSPLFAGRNEDGVLYFVFSDVRDAEMAWKIVDKNFEFFRGARKGFWADPCERPLLSKDAGAGAVDISHSTDQESGEGKEGDKG